jgi:hypothetical protein
VSEDAWDGRLNSFDESHDPFGFTEATHTLLATVTSSALCLPAMVAVHGLGARARTCSSAARTATNDHPHRFSFQTTDSARVDARGSRRGGSHFSHTYTGASLCLTGIRMHAHSLQFVATVSQTSIQPTSSQSAITPATKAHNVQHPSQRNSARWWKESKAKPSQPGTENHFSGPRVPSGRAGPRMARKAAAMGLEGSVPGGGGGLAAAMAAICSGVAWVRCCWWWC